MRFGKCPRCGRAGWIGRLKSTGEDACRSCCQSVAYKTPPPVICAPCGVHALNLMGHITLNERCRAIPKDRKKTVGRTGEGISKHAKLVPLDVNWDPNDHIVEALPA